MDSNPRSNARPTAPPTSRSVVCVLLAACAFSSGCATAINGTTQRVAVASDPPGAQVYMNDAPVGVTPAFVEVPRRDSDLQLRLEKEGYEPTVLPLQHSRSRWLAGNVLFAGVPINEYTLEMWVGAMAMYGVLGSLWDARSGGAYRRPGLVRARLAPVRAANDASVDERGESSRATNVTRAPDAGGRTTRNRLIPMQLADKVGRLTGRWTAWDPDPDRYPKPVRP